MLDTITHNDTNFKTKVSINTQVSITDLLLLDTNTINTFNSIHHNKIGTIVSKKGNRFDILVHNKVFNLKRTQFAILC